MYKKRRHWMNLKIRRTNDNQKVEREINFAENY